MAKLQEQERQAKEVALQELQQERELIKAILASKKQR
jgi:hypothetical protein